MSSKAGKATRKFGGDKRSATDFSADGTVNQPYGGPAWNLSMTEKRKNLVRIRNRKKWQTLIMIMRVYDWIE